MQGDEYSSDKKYEVNDPHMPISWGLLDHWEKMLRYQKYFRWAQDVNIAFIGDGIEYGGFISEERFSPGFDFTVGAKGVDIKHADASVVESYHDTQVALSIVQPTCDASAGPGMAHLASTIPIRIIEDASDETERVSVEMLALGIKKALDKKADVINISLDIKPLDNEQEAWQKPENIQVAKQLLAAVEEAYKQNVVIVLASGNYAPNDNVPELFQRLLDHPGVITVGSYNANNELASYSSHLNGVDILAAGGEPMTSEACTPEHLWESKALGIVLPSSEGDFVHSCAGTSFATPQVAAAAAIVIGEYKSCPYWSNSSLVIDCPSYTAINVRKAILNPYDILKSQKAYYSDSSDVPTVVPAHLYEKAVASRQIEGKPKLDFFATECAAYELIEDSSELDCTDSYELYPSLESPDPNTLTD
ncbi:MAG: S8 family serine peptidase [Verrucomicrobiota bacterium]